MRWLRGMVDRLGVAGELLVFLWERKLWWMIPMVIVLVAFGLLLILSRGVKEKALRIFHPKGVDP